ncbi:MAG: hypothetical protein FJ279_37330 [Planctomycetes bacterium]|nr:hypothetical protein [Planctomycetota bacterium]
MTALALTSIAFGLSAEPLIPPTSLAAFDTPNDSGATVCVTWPASSSDGPGVEYVLYAALSESGPFERVAARGASDTSYKTDRPDLFGFRKANGATHLVTVNPRQVFGKDWPEKGSLPVFFRLALVRGEERVDAPVVARAEPKPNWVNWAKTNNFIIVIVFCAIVLAFIARAKRRPDMFLRKIAGLEALDDALGRATEMGRPVLFVHGLGGLGSIATVASINILGRIGRRVAEFDTTLKVVNNDPMVLSVSQEVVKQAYIEAGRPDSYNEDNIFLAATEQFPYVAAVGGIMVRERPAANVFMGVFFAESLLLAETGASTGAIQLAGTDSYTQLPFFITTCDYTLIGEELYAASAYLSREPLLLGTLRGQDVGKAFLILLLVLGTLLATLGYPQLAQLFKAF